MSRPTTESRDQKLTDLLDRLSEAAGGAEVSVSDVLAQLGSRAITPFILVVAVLMISPLSGIPGAPTFAAIIIVMLSAQALFGRRRLWLPGWIMRLHIRSAALNKAIDWIRKPCAFIDRHSTHRLAVLTDGPMRWVTLLMCAVVPLFWPPLEVLPFFTSFGALIVSLFAFGLFTRDGVFVLAGYIIVATLICVAFTVF